MNDDDWFDGFRFREKLCVACALSSSLSLWFLFNMLVVEVVGACQKLI